MYHILDVDFILRSILRAGYGRVCADAQNMQSRRLRQRAWILPMLLQTR